MRFASGFTLLPTSAAFPTLLLRMVFTSGYHIATAGPEDAYKKNEPKVSATSAIVLRPQEDFGCTAAKQRGSCRVREGWTFMDFADGSHFNPFLDHLSMRRMRDVVDSDKL